MKPLFVALVLVLSVQLVAVAIADEEGPPASFFVGKYEIVGRNPGTAGRAYTGWAEVQLNGEKLSIVRCVGGKASHGSLELGEATADGVRVVRSRFEMDGKALEATCQTHVDLDNYARLTCYTYPANEPAIATPGIEALFHAKWPGPDLSAGCP